MKLHLAAPTNLNTFTGYGTGFVMINNVRHESNVIVLPERVAPWSAHSFATLTPDDFAGFAGLDLELVLLGTGDSLRFPHPRLVRALTDARIGLEVMDLQAACRTFNILMAEDRKVAAALLFF